MIGKVNTTNATIAEAKKLGITELSNFLPIIYTDYHNSINNFVNSYARLKMVFDEYNNMWFLGDAYYSFKVNEITFEKTESVVLQNEDINHGFPLYYNNNIYFFYQYESSNYNIVLKYDIQKDNLTQLNDIPKFGTSENGIGIRIGDYAYIINNYHKLLKYDFNNDTYTNLTPDTQFYFDVTSAYMASQDEDIYIINDNSDSNMGKYNTKTNEYTDMGKSILSDIKNRINGSGIYIYKNIMYCKVQQNQTEELDKPLISFIKFDLIKNKIIGSINPIFNSSYLYEAQYANYNIAKIFGNKNKLYIPHSMGCKYNTVNNQVESYLGIQRFILLDKGGKSE